MIVDLEKKDIIHLIKGTTPYYSLFEFFIEQNYGSYCKKKYGKVHSSWVWNDKKLEKMTDEQLFELYQTCLNSYK